MLKKILIVLTIAFVVFPSLALADNWGIGIGSGGVSGGYSGNGFSFGFGLGGGGGAGAGGGGWSLGNIMGFGLPSGSIYGIIRNILLWILAIFGILGVIGFVIAGIMYLVSAGDDDMITKAKTAMNWSIIGVIVGLVGVVVIQAVDFALRGYSQF